MIIPNSSSAVGIRISSAFSLSPSGTGSFVSNFLTQNGVSSFTADAHGFGEVSQEVMGDKVKNYTYRADGKIASFSSGALSAGYHYDGLDRLVAKTINDGASFTQTFTHLADENRVLLGKAGDGSITTYIDGQGAAERLGEVKNGVGKGYITDHLGSVLNSPVAGSWKSFGLFGENSAPTKITPSTSAVNYGFTGHLVDTESGLNRTEYRQYNPTIGRWLSQDPLGLDAMDMNIYRYAFNNSLIYTDPDGRWVGPAFLIVVSIAGQVSYFVYNVCGQAAKDNEALLAGKKGGLPPKPPGSRTTDTVSNNTKASPPVPRTPPAGTGPRR